MSETPPTIFISYEVARNNQAMSALRETLTVSTGSGAFQHIVMLKSFDELHESTLEYAHDFVLYRKQADVVFATATTSGDQIERDISDVSIVAITQAEWDSGMGAAKRFLEYYLDHLLSERSVHDVITMYWDEDLRTWVY